MWSASSPQQDPRAGAGHVGGRLIAELAVRLQPRARRNEIAGERDGRIVVRVTAPPVEGRANAALVKLIAKRTGVAKREVTIARGERSRDKLVRVEGLDDAELRRALGL